jgi:hypothetical protein
MSGLSLGAETKLPARIWKATLEDREFKPEAQLFD